ncbi:unnamed protein product, partial [Prorocentrum cordatum]
TPHRRNVAGLSAGRASQEGPFLEMGAAAVRRGVPSCVRWGPASAKRSSRLCSLWMPAWPRRQRGCPAPEWRPRGPRCGLGPSRASPSGRAGPRCWRGSAWRSWPCSEDLGSKRGQLLRDEFSGGSELAAECELARAAWLERSGSRRGGESEPEEELGALALAADCSEVGPEGLRESEGGNVVPVPCGLHGDRRASEPSGADPAGLGQECGRSKRASFAPWPDVVDLEVGALGGTLGGAGALRRCPVPQWAGPAWASQANAADLVHLCECERLGISARHVRGGALELEVFFRMCKPSGVAPLGGGSKHRAKETPRPPPVAVVGVPVGGSAIERAVGMGPPLVADSVDCAAGDGHSSSEGVVVSFLGGFSVAAVARAAKGPKSGVESLLDLAE